jgi:multidrug resistance efflux pump
MEKLVRSIHLRVLLATALIAVAGWSFLPHLTHRISSSAYVNAAMLRVAAPFGGQLSEKLPGKGEYFAGARSVTLIDAFSPDRRQLLVLEQQYALAREHVELAGRQLAEIAAADRDLAKRSDQHRHAVIARLTQELAGARADRAGCDAQEVQHTDARLRAEALAGVGYVARGKLEEIQSQHRITVARCDALSARMKQLQTQIDAARQDVFVQDGFGGAPYAQQQRDRLLLRRQELEAERLRERARMTQLEGELVEERQRLARLTHYDLQVPAEHVVWAVAASPGSVVVAGQTILDLADCARRFVVVEVPERDFEAIRPGDLAAVRLLGSSEWSNGKIQRVRGSAAQADDRLLAAKVPNPTPRNITVEVALPPEPLASDDARFCDIGRLAEVRFDRANLGIVAAIARLFGAADARAERMPPSGPASAR